MKALAIRPLDAEVFLNEGCTVTIHAARELNRLGFAFSGCLQAPARVPVERSVGVGVVLFALNGSSHRVDDDERCAPALGN